jgi:hypothetical protein
MGTPKPSYGPPKLVESRGIEGIPPRTHQTLGQRKTLNRAPFLTDLGEESKEKEPRRVFLFMTSSCHSCHHATRTWSRWPSGPSSQAYLSSPHLKASPATTFHACSSSTPTPDKLQPAPAILSQESVHTMLSITDHSRKRPSTGPQTTHGSQWLVFILSWYIIRSSVKQAMSGQSEPRRLKQDTEVRHFRAQFPCFNLWKQKNSKGQTNIYEINRNKQTHHQVAQTSSWCIRESNKIMTCIILEKVAYENSISTQ